MSLLGRLYESITASSEAAPEVVPSAATKEEYDYDTDDGATALQRCMNEDALPVTENKQMYQFSPETERARSEFARCLQRKSEEDRVKLLASVLTDPLIASKPSIARDLFHETSSMLGKIEPNDKHVAVKNEYDQDTDDGGRAEHHESDAESDNDRPRKRPKKFERQNGLMVWLRDNDNSKAEQLLAYFDDVDYGDKEDQKEDYAWIRWNNNIGKTVRVPTSRMENFDEVTKNMYAWCESPSHTYDRRMYVIPYNCFLFWRKLKTCETWGEIKVACDDRDDDFVRELKYRYAQKCGHDDPDEKWYADNLKEHTEIDIKDDGDFCLYDHYTYGEDPVSGIFPPLIDHIMHTEAHEEKSKRHWWLLRNHGERNGGWHESAETYKIDMKEKEAVLKEMKERNHGAIHCPELSRRFPDRWAF